MTCRDIPNTSVPSYDTLQQMYVGLGIRRLPTGVHMNVDPALPTGGINLGVLTPESIACFDTLAGIAGGSTYNNTALHGNIRDIRVLVDYFRGAGNTGDANVISGEEIDAYVHAYADGLDGDERRRFNAQEYRDLTVSNIAAYVAMVQYLGGGTPATPALPAAPAEANTAAIRSFGSVQQMYTGLVGTTAGSGAASTRSSVAEDVPSGGIPLGVLNEANIQRFADAIGWNPTQDPNSPLARNAKDILDLVDYFRGDGNLEGGDANVITSAEIDAYVRAYVEDQNAHGNRTITFDNYRPIVVGNLRAMVACIEYISNPPTLPAVNADAGPPDAGTVDAGTGPRVTAENRDAGTGGTGGVPNNGNQDSGLNLPSWLVPALGALGLGSLATYFVMRNRGTPPPSNGGGNNTPPAARKDAPPARTEADARTDRRSSNPPPPPPKAAAAANNPPAARPAPAVAADDDMADVLKDLEGVKASQSPAGNGSPVAVGNTVTADNVMITGPNAEPVSGVNENVVRAQIVLQFRGFLSQTARDALVDGHALPQGADLVNSSFTREVDELVDRVVSEYHTRMGTEEGRRAMADLWENQRSDRGYIVRRGVPQNMLREIVSSYITEHSASARSPFAGGVGAEMRSDAERRAGETEFFDRSMREVMRTIGR